MMAASTAKAKVCADRIKASPLADKRREETRAMDEDVLKRFLAAAGASPYRAAILFMLNTGLRSGEICALDIQDCQPRIRIGKAMTMRLSMML